MEVPRLGTKSELQLPATATATWDPSCVCDLCCSLPKRWILNPLSEARDRTHNLMGTSWVCYRWATTGTPHRAPFLCSCHTMEMWHSTPPVSPQDSHSASPSSPSQHPSLSSPRPFPSNLLVSSSALFQILLSAPGALISVRKLFQMEVIPSEFGCQQNHLMPASPVETELSSTITSSATAASWSYLCGGFGHQLWPTWLINGYDSHLWGYPQSREHSGVLVRSSKPAGRSWNVTSVQ